MKNFLLLLVILITAFYTFSYRITQVPPGINGDESGIGYNAILISRNLTDENNNFLPLFIFASGSDWKQPVSVYATAVVFKFLGHSLWSLRLTSVLFVLISIVLLFLVTKELMGVRYSWMGILIFIITPIVMIQSHLALENIAVLPFILFWIFMLIKFEKDRNRLYLVLGGGSLGVGLFSYLGMRIFAPALILISLIYLLKQKGGYKNSFYFLGGSIPFFILMYIANSYYPGAVFGHFEAPLPSINEFLLRYISIFDPSFLFLKGDITPYHSTGETGMFLIGTLPIFLIGVYKILRGRKPLQLLILSSFFLSPLLFGFIPDIYRASRILALVPLFTIISTIGFVSLGRNWRFLILTLVIINYIFFLKDYWFDYPKRVTEVFPIQIERTYEFRFKE